MYVVDVMALVILI